MEGNGWGQDVLKCIKALVIFFFLLRRLKRFTLFGQGLKITFKGENISGVAKCVMSIVTGIFLTRTTDLAAASSSLP